MMLNQEMAETYRQWIMSCKDPLYTIESQPTQTGQRIILTADYAQASIVFTEIRTVTVVELGIITRKDDRNRFYLHFEVRNLDRAKELFNEMITCLRQLQDDQKQKVILCCTSGLTTSFFASRLQEYCDFTNDEYAFSAVSYDRLFAEGFECDAILLAPQIAYLYDRIKGIFKDIPVLLIPAAVFARYDAEQTIHLLRDSVINDVHNEKQAVKKLPNSTGTFLTIVVISEYRVKRILYRVYRQGEVVHTNTIMKERYSVSDLEDLIDVVCSMYTLDQICIATPGVIDHGVLTFKSEGIYDVEVQNRFESRYGIPVTFCNDANAMALGYYCMQDTYRTLSFYFHPQASRICGVGNIIDGHLHVGKHALAGEMQYIVNALSFSDDPLVLARTPEGSLELVAGYLTAIIACVDPEAIVIASNMVPDLDELKERLVQNIKPELLPDLIKADDVPEFMFAGCAQLLIDTETDEKR